MKDCSALLIGPDSSIGDAIAKIDSGGMQIALVVDHAGVLLGTITDGDVRRGLLRGLLLDATVDKIMNPSPITTGLQTDRDSILSIMKRKSVHQVPLVDAGGRLIGLETLDEILIPRRRNNVVVLMAGGEGARLRPLTNEIPKPMLKVGSKPLLESIIQNFASYGFWRFCIAVNYKAELIEQYFGDGSGLNVEISYLRESEKLGTAGALSLISEIPDEPVMVMNADILTKVDFGSILNFHQDNRAAVTLCVREHTHVVPYGVVHLDNNKVFQIDEKPVQRNMVSAGIYVVEPAVLGHLTSGQYLDMPDLIGGLLAKGESVVGFPIHEYWMDIGRPEDLQSAQKYILSAYD